MKKLVILWVGSVIVFLCTGVIFTWNVYAQQGGTPNIRTMPERRALQQQRHALQQRIQGYRQQGQQLHYSMGGKGKYRMGNSRPQRSTNNSLFGRRL